ncbi:unnamed protein product, partial [Notodromas monacha]
MATASGTTNTGMVSLIKTINELHDALSSAGTPIHIDLPQIAVVGGQSAGKSSVLENIAGRLPATRNRHEYAEFLHLPGKKLRDFDVVRREIEAETDRVAASMSVSPIPINLKWYSPNVVDLTLVDLPGLTKNPIGEQSASIVQEIRDMVIEFIQPENTIILAVSPANQDIANSDAIQVAKLVDPEGLRTIGVLTKLDLMDAGTDARDILENRLLPLKKGYIGVVNRSQKDINDRKRIELALAAEHDFFRRHTAYSHMADRMGTRYLQDTLNRLLHAHIKEKLPGIRSDLQEKRQRLTDRIHDLGGFPDDTKRPSDIQEFNRYLEDFKEVMQREILGHDLDIDQTEMSVGVMINMTYYAEISDFLDVSIHADPDEVLKILSNLAGVQNQLFPSDQSFKIVIGKLMQLYKEPLKKGAGLIAGLLSTLVEKASRKLDDVPKMKAEVRFKVNEKISENLEVAKKHLLAYVDSEASFINTKHPDFKYRTASDIRKLQDEGHAKAAEIRGRLNQQTSSTSPAVTANNRPEDKGSNAALAKSISSKQLFSGFMTGKFYQVGNSKKREKKEFYFVLATHSLSWFKNQKDAEVKGAFTLSHDIVCKVTSDVKGMSTFQFRRSSGGLLYPPNIDMIKATPLRKDDGDMWKEKFAEANIKLERSNSISSLNSLQVDGPGFALNDSSQPPSQFSAAALRSSIIVTETSRERKADWTTLLRNDVTLTGWKETLMPAVEDYLTIVDKTIHDLTPKCLQHFLVDKTLHFVRRELHAQLIGEHDVAARL